MIEDTAGGTAPEFSQDEQVQPHFVGDWNSHGDPEVVDEIPAYYKRRSAGIWTCLAVIAVALAVAAAYGYSVLREQNIQLSQLPGVVQSLPQINQHLVSTDSLLNTTRADQDHLAAQLKTLDTGSKAALVHTRQEMAAWIAQTQHAWLSGVNQKAGDLQAQLSQLVSQQNAYQARLAQLETQLVEAKSELAAARTDYAAELATLREQQGQEGRELEAITSSLPTRQVFFKIQKNQDTGIAPGISFRLTKIDVGHQRFDGWIEAAPGHEKVLVQNQEVRSPVMFFPSEQGKPFLLVATRVNQQGVGGYFLIPAANGSSDQAHLITTSAPKEPFSEATEPVSSGADAR